MRQAKTLDSTQAFEAALAADPLARYRLRLFITGITPKSARAIENIRDICETTMPGRYDLEVIDVYQHPEEAQSEQIVVTPTLVKKLPLPFRRMIGDLSDRARVLAGLDILQLPPAVKAPEEEHGA